MNRAVTLLLAVAVSVPLAAEEPKSPPSDAATASKEAATATAATDSPLVAASKRANRLGRKPAFVITNETLKTTGSGAHVTTAETQAPIPVVNDSAKKQREAVLAKRAADDKKRKEKELAARQKAAAERKQRALAAASDSEDDYYAEQEDADPAIAEKRAQDTAAIAAKPPGN